MSFVNILFYVFSLLLIISAVAVVASRNPVHSVLCLIFAFFNAAGLFILLGAEMLAMLLVIVYVGAVAVLFLFVVMMLNIKTSSLKKGFQAYLPLGLILGAILFAEIVMVISNSTAKIEVAAAAEPAPVVQTTEVVNELKAEKPAKEKAKSKKGKSKDKKAKDSGSKKLSKKPAKKPEEKIVEKEVEAPVTEVAAEQTPEKIEAQSKTTNAAAIGKVLYTQYILYFQLSGLILLVAMIGAIVLTLRHREGVRRQKASVQTGRKGVIEMVKVTSGEGIK